MNTTQTRKETRLQAEAGYTLLEVLIAISIFMVGILAIGSMQAAALKSNSSSMGLTEAVNVGQSQVEQILATPFDPTDPLFQNPNQSTFTSAMGDQYNVVWEATTFYDWDSDGSNEAAEITVTVSWNDMMGSRSVNFTFMKTTQF